MFPCSLILAFSFQILLLFHCASALSDSLDVNNYLLEGLGGYQDHEILNIDRGPQEDIIYITRREPSLGANGCLDCDYFTPWDENNGVELSRRDNLVSAPDRVNMTQLVQHIRRGDNTKAKKITCEDGSNIELKSYPYPTNDQLAKAGSRIYDFEPFDRPEQASYYQLRSIQAFQLRTGSVTNRAVSVEHILEWQVLIHFIESDGERCKHLTTNFNEKVDIDTVWNVKDSLGKSNPEPVKRDSQRAMDWIVHQYPGYKNEENPFSYEFVSLHDGVNQKKERLWSEASTSSKIAKGFAKKPDLVAANKWKKWAVENRYQMESLSTTTGSKRPRKSKTWTPSKNNEGKCNAVVALRDIIGVYRYHSYAEIQDIMTAQVNRIGAAFKYLEEGPLKKPSSNYTPMVSSLESQWNTYMKARYASAIANIESSMKALSEDLEKAKVKRSWLKQLKRGTGNTAGPLCGQEKDKQKMNDRITLLLKEYKAVKGRWKNPMP